MYVKGIHIHHNHTHTHSRLVCKNKTKRVESNDVQISRTDSPLLKKNLTLVGLNWTPLQTVQPVIIPVCVVPHPYPYTIPNVHKNNV